MLLRTVINLDIIIQENRRRSIIVFRYCGDAGRFREGGALVRAAASTSQTLSNVSEIK
jgi:hypothetical protein